MKDRFKQIGLLIVCLLSTLSGLLPLLVFGALLGFSWRCFTIAFSFGFGLI